MRKRTFPMSSVSLFTTADIAKNGSRFVFQTKKCRLDWINIFFSLVWCVAWAVVTLKCKNWKELWYYICIQIYIALFNIKRSYNKFIVWAAQNFFNFIFSSTKLWVVIYFNIIGFINEKTILIINVPDSGEFPKLLYLLLNFTCDLVK